VSWGFSPATRERRLLSRLDCQTHPDFDRSLYRYLCASIDGSDVPGWERLVYRLSVEFDGLPGLWDALTGHPDDGDWTVYGSRMGLCRVKPLRRQVRQLLDERPVINLVAVGCSASKHSGPRPARDLYRGSYWTCKRRCAQRTADDWRIISAEHGLLDPNRVTDDYERTPDDLRGVPVDHDGDLTTGEPVETMLDEWALRVHESLRDWIHTAAGSVIVPRDVQLAVLVGQRYETPLVERGVFDLGDVFASDVAVRFPWRDADLSGNGEQMAWLNAEAGVTGGGSA
jgi:hypothetical protein